MSVMQKITAQFDQWQGMHHKYAQFGRIGLLPISGLFAVLALIAVLFAGFANYEVRQSQYEVWQSKKELTHLGDTPLFSTTDASLFLGMARSYHETGDANAFLKKRLTPNYDARLQEAEPRDSMRDFPLLSVLIAHLSPDQSTDALLKTGNALIPILGFVMALGVLLAFGAAGFWLEGAVAAIGAGLAPTFLIRSAIGRIDTDILNLGFFYAVLGLTIFAARAKSWRAAIAWVIAAGLCLNLFFWWYDKAFMGWAFTVGLIWLSFISSRDWRRPVVLAGLFVVISGLLFKGLGIAADNSYLIDGARTGALVFPNTFETITELRVVPFASIMTSIAGSLWLGLVGVAGLALFAFRHPVLAVVYGPATIFALANFLIGNRAVFYSAPMIWFGIAFLALMVVRTGWLYAPAKLKALKHGEFGAVAVITACLLGGVFTEVKIRNYVPNPSFPVEVMRGLAAMEDNLPDDAVVASWWDYGYASLLFNGYDTLHDGGSQKTPVTHYVARALLATDQRETHGILTSLASDGLAEIEANSTSVAALNEALLRGADAKKRPVFLVLSEQMGGWMGSISKLGMWDPAQGAPINVAGSPYGPQLFYTEMSCRLGDDPSIPYCNNQKINLKLGTVNDQPVLSAITRATNGVQSARAPHHEKGMSVLHMADLEGKGTRVLGLHQRLESSSFHKLFHLGTGDPDYFQLVYDDYPFMRIYALR